MRDVRDDPDLAARVVTDSRIAIYQQKMNIFFSLMFGENGSSRFTISKSFLAKCLGAEALSREDEEYFLQVFKYIKNYYKEYPAVFPSEERSFFLRTIMLRWRLGAPVDFAEFIRRVSLKDTSEDPLSISSLL